MSEVVCDGRGSAGSHCCVIDNEVCPLLVFDEEGTPRCSVWGKWDESPYLETAAAAYYEKTWPGKGYTCADWPQNIPEVMALGIGLCCWGN